MYVARSTEDSMALVPITWALQNKKINKCKEIICYLYQKPVLKYYQSCGFLYPRCSGLTTLVASKARQFSAEARADILKKKPFPGTGYILYFLLFFFFCFFTATEKLDNSITIIKQNKILCIPLFSLVNKGTHSTVVCSSTDSIISFILCIQAN